jgi:hypothetical protein
MQSTLTLYYPYSEIENFDGHDIVCVSWFCYGRQHPVASYEELIQDFNEIEDEEDIKRQKMAINEYFSFDELNELKDYLSKHPVYSSAEFSSTSIYIPFRRKQAPLTTVPRADKRHFYPIYQDENYPLNFKAVGFHLENYNYPFSKIYEPDKAMYKLYNDPVTV